MLDGMPIERAHDGIDAQLLGRLSLSQLPAGEDANDASCDASAECTMATDA